LPNVVLQADSLVKRFDQLTAVDRLSLEVHEGEVFGFLGPNGAGKTTSISMMCGLLKPDAGSVTIRGRRLHDGEDVRSLVGVCPQSIVIWPLLTCREQLVHIGEMYGVARREAGNRALHLLDKMGLRDKADVQARKLSGGMQRRLNLLLALVHDPEVLVLDEPEAGLDPQSRVLVREYIHSLARQKTVILTTHNMDEAERVADRVAIIDHGKMLAMDTPERLKLTYGAGDTVELEWRTLTPEQSTRLAEYSNRNDESHFDGAGLVFRSRNAADKLPEWLEAVRPICGMPARVQLRENSLEDVFISLTGRGLRE
jgi:ABC-2 type transport system ATP-binding protein